ncbi:MAG TPA: ATP-binding protein, partial [Candidatus Saccharimonadales bacterium]|nr:ATP-binding protein [Candidatus Saccharimonadales bacterium]
GKTARAKEIESEYSALRLTPDEWLLALHGDNLDRPTRQAVRDPIEALQWEVAKRALSIGCNVVQDWGLWSIEERKKYRQEAESLGAKVKIVFLDLPLDELWKRISSRPESQKGTLHIKREELDEWSTRFERPSEEELSEKE